MNAGVRDVSTTLGVDEERQEQCKTHGAYVSHRFKIGYSERWSSCSSCLDEEHQRREDQRLQQEAEARLRRDAILRKSFFECSGVRGRYLDASFDTFVAAAPEKAKKAAVARACRAYAESPALTQQWAPLWLIGPPGTGKTHLGAAMARVSAERLVKPAVVTARGLVQQVRATWKKDAVETEAEVLDGFTGAGVLILDELGVGFGSEGEIVQLYDVLDLRYQLERAVVVISNLPVPELRAFVGDRLFDRLRENAQVLLCDWPSHRGNAP